MSLCVTLKSWTCSPCASLPIGMSIHVKKAKADRPAETFQEAAYLVFSFSLQEPLFRESFLRLRFHTGLYVPGGPCCHTFCCLSPFPTRSLLGRHSLSFPLAAAGSWASWVARAALPPPAVASFRVQALVRWLYVIPCSFQGNEEPPVKPVCLSTS